jgi:hypothetical protein
MIVQLSGASAERRRLQPFPRRSGGIGGVFSANFAGNPIGTGVSVGVLDADDKSLGIFLNGGVQMGDAAQIWDDTFLGIEVLREMGGGQGGEPLSTPKLVRWHCSTKVFANRELVHVIAPIRHETMAERVTFVYLAVAGASLPTSAGYVRGGMIYPSFDIITREPSGHVLLHHFITCHLRGWMPNWFQRCAVDSAVLTQLESEIEHIMQLFGDPKFKELVTKATNPQ